MTVADIQTQIDTLNSRRAALSSQRDTQAQAVQTAQAALVAGTGSPADAASARAALLAIGDALDTLDGQISDAQTRLADEQAASERAENLAACAASLATFATHKAAFDAAFTDACQMLLGRLETLLDEGDGAGAARADVMQRLNLTGAANSQGANPDLILLRAQVDPDALSALLAWGRDRPGVFSNAIPTSYDVEMAFGHAFERRETLARQQTNRAIRSAFAEPPAPPRPAA